MNTQQFPDHSGRVVGVDFSGGNRAGEKIWCCVARGLQNAIQVEQLVQGEHLPQSGASREEVYPALVNWLATREAVLCGVDFPLSLSEDSLGTTPWTEWVTSLDQYSGPEEFRSAFPDARRLTDVASKAPFSPLNLRLFRQTYYGLRAVVLPLHQSHGAAVVPLQEPRPDTLNLIEVCPASQLKKAGMYLSYKGRSSVQLANRHNIWDYLTEKHSIVCPAELATRVLEDPEGDALDAVISAVICIKVLQQPHLLTASSPAERVEGRIYFE